MKALLPTDSTPGTYFMAAFLLRLPTDMIDHIISKDFKDCTKMSAYEDMLYSRRRGNTVATVNTNYEAAINAVSGGRHRDLAPCQVEGTPLAVPAGAQPPEDPATITLHTATRRGSASQGASGSRETEQPPRTKHSRWRHDFFTG
jgi:hypothetical protein